jgi:hypothetical protein
MRIKPVELIIGVALMAAFFLLLGWMQADDANHAAIDQSYAEETRLDMKAQSERQKRDAKWDELNAQANTLTAHPGIGK